MDIIHVILDKTLTLCEQINMGFQGWFLELWRSGSGRLAGKHTPACFYFFEESRIGLFWEG